MAVCRYCGLEMTAGDGAAVRGCSPDPVAIEGTSYQPVRCGSERGWRLARGRCGDCGAWRGEVHHHGCDVELCPRCGGQLITCGCLWADEEDLDEDGDEEVGLRLLT